jgi:Zn-dependent M28 family amino/carboxypeptidase
LLGSSWYADHPTLPLDRTMAVINLDMVGRNTADEIYVIGSDFRSSELHDLNVEAARDVGLRLNYDRNSLRDRTRLFFRSDQYNFARHGIPAIFYTGGTHVDYHRPTDTPEKIVYRKVQRVARLTYTVAWRLANRELPLALDRKVGVED